VEAAGIGDDDMRRLHCDTELWHVFARGTRRLLVFRDDEDYRQFLQIMSYSLRQSGARVLAYALMINHYHLVLEATSEELTALMRRLNKTYSRYHNKRYDLTGHTFDGPYQTYRQRSPLLSLATLAYVFANPVKAGACSTIEDYPWTSYLSFIGKPGSPFPINPTPFLDGLDSDPKRVWRLFHQALRHELDRLPRPIAGRPSMVDVHLSQFASLLDYATENPGLMAGEDPLPVAAYWARQAGVAPRVIAKALGLKESRTIRNMIRTFAKRLEASPALARLARLP
jgi:REP element-mobilizing transposase RayT